MKVSRRNKKSKITFWGAILLLTAIVSMPSLAHAGGSVSVNDHYLGEDCVDVTWSHPGWYADKWKVCWKPAGQWTGICNTNSREVYASSDLESYSEPVCGLDADEEYKFHVEAYKPHGTITIGNWKDIGNDNYTIPDYYCGNGYCEDFYAFTDETVANCPHDCNECGDGICTPGYESLSSCPADCWETEDGICTSGYEDVYNSPDDCWECGDEVCTEDYEDVYSCEEDCYYCDDGVCSWDYDEDVDSCPEDCGICGDDLCTGNETPFNCWTDCGWDPAPPIKKDLTKK